MTVSLPGPYKLLEKWMENTKYPPDANSMEPGLRVEVKHCSIYIYIFTVFSCGTLWKCQNSSESETSSRKMVSKDNVMMQLSLACPFLCSLEGKGRKWKWNQDEKPVQSQKIMGYGTIPSILGVDLSLFVVLCYHNDYNCPSLFLKWSEVKSLFVTSPLYFPVSSKSNPSPFPSCRPKRRSVAQFHFNPPLFTECLKSVKVTGS